MREAAAPIPVRTIAGVVVSTAMVAAVGALYVRARSIPLEQVAAAYAAFTLLLLPYLGLGAPGIAEAAGRLRRRPARLAAAALGVAAPCAASVVWERGPGGVLPAGGVLLFAAAPLLALLLASRLGAPPNPADALAVVLVWLPVELGWFRGLWAVNRTDPSPVVATMLGVCVLVLGYAAVRPLEGLGYRWRVRLEDAGVALAGAAVFLVVAVPAGVAAGAATISPRPLDVTARLAHLLAVALFVALPEELLFRGVIFNLIQKGTPGRHGPRPALVLSSAIFGLAHVNAPGAGWVFVLAAAWAGACYGWCYLKTGNLVAPTLAHALVNVALSVLGVATTA